MSPAPPPTPDASISSSASGASSPAFRQLLPAKSPDPTRRRSSPHDPARDGPRKSYVLAACEACRRRKSKCSGERPVCLVCSRRGSACHYTTSVSETRGQALKRRYNQLNTADSPHRNLVELLKSISDDRALSIIRRLRAGDQPELVLGQLSAGNAVVELAVKPETRFRYVFPVVSEMPTSLLRDNPYLESHLYEAALVFPSLVSLKSDMPKTFQQPKLHERSEIQSLYVMPYHAAEAIVPRLCSACPSAWTGICKDDNLMRDLLESYFKNDYNIGAPFHIDYFLEDMATGRTGFCSSLLVNAVLAHACGTYLPFEDRGEYWNPDTMSYKFLVEAKRLWEIEASPSYVEYDQDGNPKPIALTTIQAGLTIQYCIGMSCMDRVGKMYQDRVMQMAHAMDLFNYSNTSTDTLATSRGTNGKAFTAWSVYNWDALMAYHFFRVPDLIRPPRWRLPDLMEEPRWYGDVALKYPDIGSLSPTHLGHWLLARCQFRIIMNEVAQVYFSQDSIMSAENIRQHPERSLAVANDLHDRLEAWGQGLPACLSPREMALPAHFQLHCYLQNLVVSIYSPLEDISVFQTPSPKALVVEARRRLVTLLRLYYLRHGFESVDTWVSQPLILLANMYADMLSAGTLTQADELDARATLILMIKGLRDQSRNNSVAELLFRMAKAKMRPADHTLLLSEGVIRCVEDEAKVAQMHSVQMGWPAMATTMADDPHNHSLSQLARMLGQATIAETTGSSSGSSSSSTSPLNTEAGGMVDSNAYPA